MRECRRCRVEVLDDTRICPLCRNVLEISGDGHPCTGYPDVKAESRKYALILRLYSFLAIVIEAALAAVNYFRFRGIWWSAISGIAFLYFYITLRYSLRKNTGYQKRIIIQIIGAVAMVIAIDHILGYQGWSLNYILPGAILLLDVTVIILMLLNMQNWQSYIPMQILAVVAAADCILFWRLGFITSPVPTFLALACSVCMLLGTLMLGDRKAKAELKRRFHV